MIQKRLNRRELEWVRKRVAREAARLLYEGAVDEYIDAKRLAARRLGVDVMPSNREVAIELDRIGDELEGEEKLRRLKRLREEALEVMEAIEDLEPRLIGSVWRGNIKRESDIDIAVLGTTDPEEVIERLKEAGIEVLDVDEVVITERGGKPLDIPEHYVNIKIRTPGGEKAEIGVTVSSPELERKGRVDLGRCDFFGDKITGLSVEELRKLLQEDPYRKFIPQG
ncbi:nucleotidyltransferase domain-containing protein [Methanopyrus sp. SNP6]|uniref:nucleotidyltransferase domain-containing protein n=1 Tax=Methanopyrus sp. SNP6 TaxID=1937005 RepID=UPI0011E5C4AE|nr:nucleotidyltransferase domain-containing protein [Methanopyrus sp. SNP6]